MNMHTPLLLASLLASILAGAALAADDKGKGSAPAEYILTAAQASGGQRIMTKENEPAVLFPPADPVKAQIDWKFERPVPPGLWQVDLDIFEPTGNFSPDEQVIFLGENGCKLGRWDLYHTRLQKGRYIRSAGFCSDLPLTGLSLYKSGQRNKNTVAVVAVKIAPAKMEQLEKLQMVLHAPVREKQIVLPAALPGGLYQVDVKGGELRWTAGNAKSFVTPANVKAAWVDGLTHLEIASGECGSDASMMRYPPVAEYEKESNVSALIATFDLAKSESHSLVLYGYQGGQAPKPTWFPGGKTTAVVSSWDDGRTMDMQVAQLLDKYGLKGTFYMNHHSEMISRLRELEALGMEVGSHSWSHPAYWLSSPKRCQFESVEMRAFLEKTVGHPVISFAFPFNYFPSYDEGGDYVQRSMETSGYWSARTTNTGDNRIDKLDQPLQMRTNFHFRAGAEAMKKKLEAERQTPGGIVYFWGHSYELGGNGAKTLEDELAVLGNQPDVWYATIGELMIWKFMRDKLQSKLTTDAAGGKTYNLTLPWLHPYLHQVPLSLQVPDGVESVTWDGVSIPVKAGCVSLKW